LIEYSDYRNETITIPAEDVQNASKFKFYDCFKCKIIIGGKMAQVELFKCKKCDLTVEEVMNFVGPLKCDETKIRIQKKCRTVNIEGCNEVQLFVTEEAKPEVTLTSTTSKSISIIYPKADGVNPEDSADDGYGTVVLSETYNFKFDGKSDKILSEAQDLADWVKFNNK